MKPIKIGILGFGTVATGVASILAKNNHEINRRIGRTIEIDTLLVRSLDRDNPYNLPLTTNIDDIINNPDIDIVLELMGGISPAKEYITQLLNAKKDVVTANKELIALHGNELFALARKNNVSLHFEASVAGGIPVIKSIREGLTANRISSLYGIINGTSNYILTEMTQKGRSFDDALKEAQALGYAEADPTYDVKGIDAAHKLTILASIAFGIPLNFDAVYTEGIDSLTEDDIFIANHFGYTIKHLGIAKQSECSQKVEVRVHPTLIPQSSHFANTNGAMNALLVNGNAVGPIFNYGAGAGSEPTASAVVADIIDIFKEKNNQYKTAELAYQATQLRDVTYATPPQFESKYLLKLTVNNPLVKDDITTLLHEFNVDTADLFLLESKEIVALTTKLMSEEKIIKLQQSIQSSAMIKDVSFFRIETLS